MEVIRTMLGLFINLVLPVIGIQWFRLLCDDMREEHIQNPPIFSWFAIFVTYGGLLMVILTSLFWYWSGMASLGSAYLILVAPLLMLLIAWRLYPKRTFSRFHRLAFIFSSAYLGVLAFFISIMVFVQ